MLRTTILATLILGPLIFWRYLYPYTCLSLTGPLLFAAVICWGRFVASKHRREYWASYYLKNDSSLYSLATGKTFSIIRAAVAGIIYTFTLSAFAALGGTLEMSMLFLNVMLAFVLQPKASAFIERHAAAGLAKHATKRLLAFSCLTITAMIYIVILANTKIPDYIDLTSLKATVDTASQQVASACPYINISLKGVQEFNATQWYFMVAGSGTLASTMLKYASWLAFLGYSSLALIGMSLVAAELAVYFAAPSRYPKE